MEYPQLSSFVPAGEHFDSTAINEGVYLTVGHVDAIEAALAGKEAVVLDLNSRITLAEAATQTAQDALATANATISANTIAIEERDATIASRDAEIVKLKAGPAGSMASTERAADDLNDGGVVVESATTKEAKRLRELRDKK